MYLILFLEPLPSDDDDKASNQRSRKRIRKSTRSVRWADGLASGDESPLPEEPPSMPDAVSIPPVLALLELPPPLTKHPTFKVPGGYIILRPNSMDAHCSNPAHKCSRNPCRLDRTLRPRKPRTTVSGRPLACLLAWLLHGRNCESKDRHKGSASLAQHLPEDDAFFNWFDRYVLRQAALLDESLSALVEAERPKRVDEPLEPLLFYYSN